MPHNVAQGEVREALRLLSFYRDQAATAYPRAFLPTSTFPATKSPSQFNSRHYCGIRYSPFKFRL